MKDKKSQELKFFEYAIVIGIISAIIFCIYAYPINQEYKQSQKDYYKALSDFEETLLLTYAFYDKMFPSYNVESPKEKICIVSCNSDETSYCLGDQCVCVKEGTTITIHARNP